MPARERLRITNGRVIDPVHDVDGVRDVLVEDGRIVAAWSEPDAVVNRTLDATGCVVMAGAVDMHCHIAGPAVNRARALLPEQAAADPVRATPGDPPWSMRPARDDGSALQQPLRGGSGGLMPSSWVTGYRYACLGYTTAVEAAIAPSGAAAAHLELADVPCIDRGFLLLLAGNRMLLEALARGDRKSAVALARELVARCGAFGIKAVNPGGTHLWRNGGDPRAITTIDDTPAGLDVSPRVILETLADAAADLPHPLHVHANRLGLPGNVGLTVGTLRALQGRRHHLTHAQFHAYADDGSGGFASGSVPLMDFVNEHPGTTLDVGQVMFGPAVTVTEDAEVEHRLWKLTGKRWAEVEVETEAGCGIVPVEYRADRRLSAIQWATGLEIFLLARDPWQVALSTDHPNGGSFLTYPRILATLMDPDLRKAEIARAKLPDGTPLANLQRAYTLREIAIISRAGPARMLGLAHKGHLGSGADADITVYDDGPDRERMFRHPRWVVSRGRVIVEKGELRTPSAGRTFRAALEPGGEGAGMLERWWADNGSYDLSRLGLPRWWRQRGPDLLHAVGREGRRTG